MTDDLIDKRAQELIDAAIQGGRAACNCGGPQYGTDHSPDCHIMLAWDDCVDEATDERYQQELAARTERTNSIGHPYSCCCAECAYGGTEDPGGISHY